MASRVRAHHQTASLVKDLQIDAAAEFLDEVRKKEQISASTKVNGQNLTHRTFVTYAEGLTISRPDLSLPENRLPGVSYFEIGLGTKTFASDGDQDEQAPAVRRNRPLPLSIAPEAVEFTARQRVLKDAGLEGFAGRGFARINCRVCIRRALFTPASNDREPEEEG